LGHRVMSNSLVRSINSDGLRHEVAGVEGVVGEGLRVCGGPSRSDDGAEGRWVAAVDGSQRKKRLGMELHPAMWVATRAATKC
jgi:hypothetical protein